MSPGDRLVAVVGLLQLAAAVGYAFERRWPQAAIWTGASIISFGTLALSMKT